jgi:hypothetical protein
MQMSPPQWCAQTPTQIALSSFAKALDFEKQPPSALWGELGFVWFGGQSAKFKSKG